MRTEIKSWIGVDDCLPIRADPTAEFLAKLNSSSEKPLGRGSNYMFRHQFIGSHVIYEDRNFVERND